MQRQLNWGIIGSGAIASDFARALSVSKRCRVVHVVGSSIDKARAFAERHGVPSCSAKLEELLQDKEVEAVYVATPHPLHEQHTQACIRAKLPVLCEKPLAMSAEGAERIFEAARQTGVLVVEGFMYRCHPLVSELCDRVRSGVIGKVRHIRADFGFYAPRQPESRLFNAELGGGSILDVGGYPISLVRLIAGVAVGIRYAEPVALTATGAFGPTGVDEYATALLTFPGGITAQVTSAISHDVGTGVVIFGDAGKIVLPDPWLPGGERQGLESLMIIHAIGREPQTLSVRASLPIYAIEAELVADTPPALEVAWPAMGWDDSLGNLRVMDNWRRALLS